MNVRKSLYRIRKELEEEGIVVSTDYLYHFAKRHHLRLRPVQEVYEKHLEVWGLDEDDAELLKTLVKQSFAKRHRSSSETGAETERNKEYETKDAG